MTESAIKRSLIVQSQDEVSSRCTALWVSLNGFSYRASIGSPKRICKSSLRESLWSQLKSNTYNADRRRKTGEVGIKLSLGTVLHFPSSAYSYGLRVSFRHSIHLKIGSWTTLGHRGAHIQTRVMKTTLVILFRCSRATYVQFWLISSSVQRSTVP